MMEQSRTTTKDTETKREKQVCTVIMQQIKNSIQYPN